MRIAYFVVWNESKGGTTFRGVFHKIHAQIQAWQELGHDVKLFLNTRAVGEFIQAYEPPDAISVHISTYTSLLDRWRKTASLLQDMRDWQPDVVYCRHAYFSPFLRQMVRTFPTVAEINANDIDELLAKYGYRHQYWYYRLTRDLWMKHVQGFVHVIPELPERPYYARYKKRAIVIGNSIDLESTPAVAAANNAVPHLVFIASTALWHGVDKMIKLAKHYSQWQFHLIGPLTEKVRAQLPANMKSYGYLDRSEYLPIMEKADVALGSLAVHRSGVSTGSPLKVREYLSYGIPTIIGYQDADFPQPVPFLLTLPSTEDNVESHYTEIGEFVEKWRGKRVPRHQVANLDIRIKERQRVEFMREVAQPG